MSGTGFGFGLARQVAVKDRAHGADTWIEWRVGTILIYKSLTCWGPFSFHILIHFVSLLLLTSFYKLTLQLATKPQPDSDPIRFSRILSTASSDSQIHSLLLSSLEIRAKHGIRISVSIALSSPGSYFLLLLLLLLIVLGWHFLRPKELAQIRDGDAEPWFSKPFRVLLLRMPKKWNDFPPKNRFFSLWASFCWFYFPFAFSGTYPFVLALCFAFLLVNNRACYCFG